MSLRHLECLIVFFKIILGGVPSTLCVSILITALFVAMSDELVCFFIRMCLTWICFPSPTNIRETACCPRRAEFRGTVSIILGAEMRVEEAEDEDVAAGEALLGMWQETR